MKKKKAALFLYTKDLFFRRVIINYDQKKRRCNGCFMLAYLKKNGENKEDKIKE